MWDILNINERNKNIYLPKLGKDLAYINDIILKSELISPRLMQDIFSILEAIDYEEFKEEEINRIKINIYNRFLSYWLWKHDNEFYINNEKDILAIFNDTNTILKNCNQEAVKKLYTLFMINVINTQLNLYFNLEGLNKLDALSPFNELWSLKYTAQLLVECYKLEYYTSLNDKASIENASKKYKSIHDYIETKPKEERIKIAVTWKIIKTILKYKIKNELGTDIFLYINTLIEKAFQYCKDDKQKISYRWKMRWEQQEICVHLLDTLHAQEKKGVIFQSKSTTLLYNTIANLFQDKNVSEFKTYDQATQAFKSLIDTHAYKKWNIYADFLQNSLRYKREYREEEYPKNEEWNYIVYRKSLWKENLTEEVLTKREIEKEYLFEITMTAIKIFKEKFSTSNFLKSQHGKKWIYLYLEKYLWINNSNYPQDTVKDIFESIDNQITWLQKKSDEPKSSWLIKAAVDFLEEWPTKRNELTLEKIKTLEVKLTQFIKSQEASNWSIKLEKKLQYMKANYRNITTILAGIMAVDKIEIWWIISGNEYRLESNIEDRTLEEITFFSEWLEKNTWHWTNKFSSERESSEKLLSHEYFKYKKDKIFTLFESEKLEELKPNRKFIILDSEKKEPHSSTLHDIDVIYYDTWVYQKSTISDNSEAFLNVSSQLLQLRNMIKQVEDKIQWDWIFENLLPVEDETSNDIKLLLWLFKKWRKEFFLSWIIQLKRQLGKLATNSSLWSTIKSFLGTDSIIELYWIDHNNETIKEKELIDSCFLHDIIIQFDQAKINWKQANSLIMEYLKSAKIMNHRKIFLTVKQQIALNNQPYDDTLKIYSLPSDHKKNKIHDLFFAHQLYSLFVAAWISSKDITELWLVLWKAQIINPSISHLFANKHAQEITYNESGLCEAKNVTPLEWVENFVNEATDILKSKKIIENTIIKWDIKRIKTWWWPAVIEDRLKISTEKKKITNKVGAIKEEIISRHRKTIGDLKLEEKLVKLKKIIASIPEKNTKHNAILAKVNITIIEIEWAIESYIKKLKGLWEIDEAIKIKSKFEEIKLGHVATTEEDNTLVEEEIVKQTKKIQKMSSLQIERIIWWDAERVIKTMKIISELLWVDKYIVDKKFNNPNKDMDERYDIMDWDEWSDDIEQALLLLAYDQHNNNNENTVAEFYKWKLYPWDIYKSYKITHTSNIVTHLANYLSKKYTKPIECWEVFTITYKWAKQDSDLMIPIEHQWSVYAHILNIMREKLQQYDIHVSNKISTWEIFTTMNSLRDHIYLNENREVWDELSKNIVEIIEKKFWKWTIISKNVKNFLQN